jgi:hypothetical protein
MLTCVEHSFSFSQPVKFLFCLGFSIKTVQDRHWLGCRGEPTVGVSRLKASDAYGCQVSIVISDVPAKVCDQINLWQKMKMSLGFFIFCLLKNRFRFWGKCWRVCSMVELHSTKITILNWKKCFYSCVNSKQN